MPQQREDFIGNISPTMCSNTLVEQACIKYRPCYIYLHDDNGYSSDWFHAQEMEFTQTSTAEHLRYMPDCCSTINSVRKTHMLLI